MVYVEPPLHVERETLHPDFFILTNYGVIVIEVKDWVGINRVDPSQVFTRTTGNKTKRFPNAVETTRERAILLSNKIIAKQKERGLQAAKIPWSYAAICPKLSFVDIQRLRHSWGKEFVLGEADINSPDVLLKRLKYLFPPKRIKKSLTKSEIDLVRATIWPISEYQKEGQQAIILDRDQEKIVAEPVWTKKPEKKKKTSQEKLFDEDIASELPEKEVHPEYIDQISKNVSVRLLRGVAGSGKSLVIAQRAKYLASMYPEWNIGVLTYNKPLQEYFQEVFRGSTIVPKTFHGVCMSTLRESRFFADDDNRCEVKRWLDSVKFNYDVIRELGKDFLEKEFKWLRDINIKDRDTYLNMTRYGRGDGIRIRKGDDGKRGQIFDALQEYKKHLKEHKLLDWEEIPQMGLERIENGSVSADLFDAILVDEAQDFAPVWFDLVKKWLNSENGLLFIADDPSQSVYRNFSWKEKGIPVVGRTRWLKIPYRNTYEIYAAAYSMIKNNESIQRTLTENGEVITPVLDSSIMRHGDRPLVRKFRNTNDEIAFIKEKIRDLRQNNIRDNQIVILICNPKLVRKLKDNLNGFDVQVSSVRRYKGLEKNTVFIMRLQDTFDFDSDNEDAIAAERRLLYVGMSRARETLYMTYSGSLPKPFEILRTEKMADFIL